MNLLLLAGIALGASVWSIFLLVLGMEMADSMTE